MNVIKYKSIVAIVKQQKTLIDCKQEFNLDGTIILTPQITKFGW
jgi:hypothetical protein